MKNAQNEAGKKRPYVRPRLRTIELANEEVQAAEDCKHKAAATPVGPNVIDLGPPVVYGPCNTPAQCLEYVS